MKKTIDRFPQLKKIFFGKIKKITFIFKDHEKVCYINKIKLHFTPNRSSKDLLNHLNQVCSVNDQQAKMLIDEKYFWFYAFLTHNNEVSVFIKKTKLILTFYIHNFNSSALIVKSRFVNNNRDITEFFCINNYFFLMCEYTHLCDENFQKEYFSIDRNTNYTEEQAKKLILKEQAKYMIRNVL